MKLLVSKRLAKRWRQEFEARDDEDGERIELARRWQQYSLTANLLKSAIKKTFVCQLWQLLYRGQVVRVLHEVQDCGLEEATLMGFATSPGGCPSPL